MTTRRTSILVAAVLMAAVTAGTLVRAQDATPASAAAEAARALQALRGSTSLLVLQDGRELVAHRAGTPMAVGSSFKIALALTLRKQIEAGIHRWDEVVRIKPIWKVPGGVLYDWPDGTPMTLEMLAGFMISRSDNTGTDSIFHIVGRRNAEAYTGRNRPLLSTHDLYFFRDLRNRAWVERYRRGSEAQRRAILKVIQDRPLDLDSGVFINSPHDFDIEWHFTNRELCALIAQVADLPIMGIIAHGIDKREWARVAFKGGSEPGVISGTWSLTSKSGRTYCVSASWNNSREIVDQGPFIGILKALFDVVKR
jgi:beta-lactamase class A